jgi:hypothetical protein
MIMSACGGSSGNGGTTKTDSGAPKDGSSDSTMGMDTTTPPMDSGGGDTTMMMDSSPPPGDSAPPDTGPGDGGDAGDGNTGPCTFSMVVMGLVANDTTATATPSPISVLNGCTDDMLQSDYPPSFF